ncbi:alpha-glucoside-specific PTS transporter subunit IIBC [Pisciglobus halotolerans]|uniref:PTS system maltose-specific IIB component, Glc family /PTS system maltose-specific IIC component, Glc family n=1 Tax=Pisciglobus halotolerans TaxID=745365 RepID=A0A1I3DPN3_9LACT|nr:alpha-glucoside-specific PTS transporter subunit IIBC [Pisciglobus halotolerans]SFH88700.1 PTS system maltose-specific IIB component, Glc family /PTS system maltose-specific IIC component, Glc family [Pisciglobus halotolerans]
MMAKIQRFGGAMFGPVIFFIFSGIVVALASVFTNPAIVGSIASEGTLWSNLWNVIEAGGWTVFNNMEVLFVIGLPIGLAKNAHARAAMESFVLYMTFNSFVAAILETFGGTFGIDYSAEAGGQSGLKMIAGVKTLDTGVLGAIVIASIAIYLHNRFFDKKLPDFLGIFQGSAFVGVIGFFVMFVIAFLTSWIWPIIQQGILSLQSVMVNSGNVGVFLYIFLEKALLPTGLHHFIYTPFQYGPAVVEGGTTLYWIDHLREFASSTAPLKQLFPEGGFALQGISNWFGIPGIALAFYSTAKPENRKKVLALIIPGVLTSVFAGITEPFDYTFLFIAPVLFLIHALLAATMATTMYIFGVVGDMQGGLIELIAKNVIPMGANHWQTYTILVILGIAFSAIYFFVFRFLILKFDFKTPGRGESEEEVELYTKKDYKDKKNKVSSGGNAYRDQAGVFLEALGGSENIVAVSNCATRLRVTVADETKVKSDEAFLKGKAHGVVRKGKAFQVIVGLSVPQVREEFEALVNDETKTITNEQMV